MANQFNTVALTGRIRKEATRQTFLNLIQHLQSRSVDLLIEEEIARELGIQHLTTVAKPELGLKSDLVIVVGGDGSLLETARVVVDSQTPIIGVNRGRFGFLADIHPDYVATVVDEILAGHYQQDNRFMLEATLEGSDNVTHALNDIVLSSGNTAHMTEFEVYVNEDFMCSEHSDGLIISTPTGSTAYALSGGGPIIHPLLDAILLVPMFAHTLNSRPIVLRADMEISVKIGTRLSAKPVISCDGNAFATVDAGQILKVRRKEIGLKLLHPKNYNYFEILGRKLSWGRRLVDLKF